MAILNMNAHAYRKYISESAKPVLVEFSAPWCSYCRRIAPAYEKVAQQYGSDLVIAQINIDEEPLLAHKEQIEVIPTLVFYRNGVGIHSIVAPESKAKIEEFIWESMEKGE